MPKPPLPPDLVAFLVEPNPSVIATIRPDGSPHTAATWYLWVDGRVLVNMDEGRRRLEHLRQEPRVSLTVLGREDWYHHVTLRGHVAELMPDPQFTDIDRLSEHYTGRAYPQRDRGRVSAWIEVTSWHAWAVIGPWTGTRRQAPALTSVRDGGRSPSGPGSATPVRPIGGSSARRPGRRFRARGTAVGNRTRPGRIRSSCSKSRRAPVCRS